MKNFFVILVSIFLLIAVSAAFMTSSDNTNQITTNAVEQSPPVPEKNNLVNATNDLTIVHTAEQPSSVLEYEIMKLPKGNIITGNAVKNTNLADYKCPDCNIVLISLDTLRADHLGCYGYSKNTSPNIDNLAAKSILFENHYSQSTWTLPSHMSIFTSLYPSFHGVIKNKLELSKDKVTITEILSDNDYATAGFISGPYVKSFFGFDRGFDLYDESALNKNSLAELDVGANRHITSPYVTHKVKGWLKDNHQEKFFLFIHFMDAHSPYIPPDPYRSMFTNNSKIDYGIYEDVVDDSRAEQREKKRARKQLFREENIARTIPLYDGEIAFIDHHVGQILNYLEELGLSEKTIIIVTGDHGEEFYEHGNMGHKSHGFDEILHVPLIINLPGSQKNIREDPATNVDVAPTILDILGIEAEEQFQGVSLLRNCEDEVERLEPWQKLDKKRVIYHELHRDDRLLYIIVRLCDEAGCYKYTNNLGKNNTFYNLEEDPLEKNDLILEESEIKNQLAKKIGEYRSEYSVPTDNVIELDQETLEQLKALGYVND